MQPLQWHGKHLIKRKAIRSFKTLFLKEKQICTRHTREYGKALDIHRGPWILAIITQACLLYQKAQRIQQESQEKNYQDGWEQVSHPDGLDFQDVYPNTYDQHSPH